MYKLTQLFSLSLIFSLSTIFSASATSFSVTTLNDAGPGSLRVAINDATDGDSILFSIQGVILLDSQLTVDKSLFLIGPGPDKLALSGQNNSRIMAIPQGDSLVISGLTFRDGNVIEDPDPEKGGGAIDIRGAASIKECIFVNNTAKFGGAMTINGFNEGSARLILQNCTLYDNSAIEYIDTVFITPSTGGALYINGGLKGHARVTATNCTFSGNYAAVTGGAVFAVGDIVGGTSFRTTSCTISYNRSPETAGVDNFIYADVTFQNTLIGQNEGKSNRPDISGFTKSFGYNLIGVVGTANYQAESTDLLDVIPMVAPLALNGSIYPTHALACESPAIDAGNPTGTISVDQRGFPRIGVPDIGSLERDGIIEKEIFSLEDAGYGTLRQAILLACEGDTLDLSQLSGVISLESTIEFDKSLTLLGNQSSPLILSGGDSLRIFNVAAGVELNLQWFSLRNGNPSLLGGGAILNKGTLTIGQCSFQDNVSQSGGAIANYGDEGPAVLTISNSTFSGNEATALDGGAIDNRAFDFGATATLIHCTFTRNEAANKGGALYNDQGGILSLENTLVSQNTCPLGPDVFGEVSLSGANLIFNQNETVTSGAGTALSNVNPMLASLGNYGGPSRTHKLLAGSPMIDAAESTSLTIDQRGEARVFGSKADIGAYEFDPSTAIGDEIVIGKILVVPNPNRGNFELKGENLPFGSIDIEVFTIAGKRIYKRSTQSHSGQFSIQIDLQNQPKGMYLIRIRQESLTLHKKFLVQ